MYIEIFGPLDNLFQIFGPLEQKFLDPFKIFYLPFEFAFNTLCKGIFDPSTINSHDYNYK